MISVPLALLSAVSLLNFFSEGTSHRRNFGTRAGSQPGSADLLAGTCQEIVAKSQADAITFTKPLSTPRGAASVDRPCCRLLVA